MFKLGGCPNDDGDDDNCDDGSNDDLHLHVLPEHLPLHPDRRGVELLAALLQVLGPVLQVAQLPVSLKDLNIGIILHSWVASNVI